VPSTVTSASNGAEGRLSYPGWKVAAAAHLAVMVSFGPLLIYTFGIFLKPLTAEFPWRREEASRAFASLYGLTWTFCDSAGGIGVIM
jgi:hypothetical protein